MVTTPAATRSARAVYKWRVIFLSKRYALHQASTHSRAAVIRMMTNVIDGNPYLADGLRYLFYSNPNAHPTQMGFPVHWASDPIWG